MKRCSKCLHTYTDETLNFCRDDGTPLVNVLFASSEPVTSSLQSADLPTENFKSQTSLQTAMPSIAVLPFINISADAENELTGKDK